MSSKYGPDITIREVMNGFVVKIGCEHIVIEGQENRKDAVDSLCGGLQDYLYDRKGQEKLWYDTYRPYEAPVGETAAEETAAEEPARNAEGAPQDTMDLP